MMLRERVVLGEALLEIDLGADLRYRLRCGEVEYTPGARRVRGRRLPYVFRSVEQLRYDFEQDVRATGGRLGEAP
ncbi:MAG TPA: hypothetical protein VM489_14550 [Burkholderiales bacterium]|nr:hypothetical protein [Burkholderiales bacterium]